MARPLVWWSVALLAVPAVLSGLALLWAGSPTAPAPPAARASALPPESPSKLATMPTSLPAVAADPEPAAPDPTAQDPTLTHVAEVLATQPIRFTADSAELAGPAADTVRRVAQLLVAGPAVPVLVEGHVADTPGGPEAVQQLSDRRAAAVAELLVACGVPAERIATRGAGATRPLGTVEESRRVEITVG
jgi:outer membrane protein OmpA-like peptidoglycan-associated protein